MTRSALSPPVRVSIDASAEGRTKQSHKGECDINTIMKKFIRTGSIAHYNNHGARYGDVPATTYHEAVQTVVEAREMFGELPAAVRKRFRNDPGEFLAFVQDPANTAEAIKLGLATARPEPTPVPAAAEPTPAP